MSTNLKVLIVEDRPDDAELTLRELAHSGFVVTPTVVESEADFRAQLSDDVNLIISDHQLPGFDALQALEILTGSGLDIPFIVVSGAISEELAVECMKRGASDYLIKDRLARLGSAVTRALELKAARVAIKMTDERERADHKEMQRLYQEIAIRTHEIQRREAQLRIITNAMPVLVGHLDLQERFLFANDACQSWFQMDKGQMIGRTLHDLVGDERYDAVKTYIAQVLSGKTATFERQVVQDGQRLSFGLTYIPETDDESKVIGFILVATNITKHKEAEEEFKLAKEAAEIANAAKTAFLANMSHEIRTPLGAVLGFSELLADQRLSSAERFSYVAAIKRNGDLLSNIINDILDLSKVEAGKLETERQDIPLADVLMDFTAILSLQAQEKGLRLTVSQDGSVPHHIRTDPLRLRQILINIVGNAIKFTQRGSVDVKIRSVLGTDGHAKISFAVKDTGLGVDPGKAAKLFEPFTQADASTKRKFGGTGLGLALSRRLANLLGGDVVLTASSLGVGSTFTITIDPGTMPTEFGENVAKGDKSPVRAAAMGNVRLDGVTILLVDDAPDNQLLVGRYLKGAGAHVETACNGEEAIRKARGKPYDVLLMDLQMPIMDGYEATAALRKSGYDKPIVALTAHVLQEEMQRCLKSGFDDHVGKPIDRSALLESIAYLCGRTERDIQA